MPYADPEHRRKYDRERKRQYYRRNPARVNMVNQAWRDANPDRFKIIKRRAFARRRARIAQVLSTLTAQEWEAILAAAGHSCIYCGAKKQLSQDHLMPISRGGPHTAENVAPACKSCNSSKGAKAVMEFLAEARARRVT
jgi:5-methylcytosine-specific restriction endonuclease McrA